MLGGERASTGGVNGELDEARYSHEQEIVSRCRAASFAVAHQRVRLRKGNMKASNANPLARGMRVQLLKSFHQKLQSYIDVCRCARKRCGLATTVQRALKALHECVYEAAFLTLLTSRRPLQRRRARASIKRATKRTRQHRRKLHREERRRQARVAYKAQLTDNSARQQGSDHRE